MSSLSKKEKPALASGTWRLEGRLLSSKPEPTPPKITSIYLGDEPEVSSGMGGFLAGVAFALFLAFMYVEVAI